MESIQGLVDSFEKAGRGKMPSREQVFRQILADDTIKAFIQQHQLSDEVVRNSMSKLSEYYREHHAYLRGEGGTMPGYHPVLVMGTNYIDVSYIPTQQTLQQQQEQKRQEVLDNRMMSYEVREARLDQYDFGHPSRVKVMAAVVDFLEKFRQNPRTAKGLYLSGPYGVGKTYLLGALAHQIVEESKVTVKMIHYPTFASEVRAAVATNQFAQQVNQVKRVDVLMLDDIGAETDNTGWLRDEVLAIILEHRMKEGLATFFSSNFDFNALQQVLMHASNPPSAIRAERIMERIRSLATEVELLGENRRHAN